MIACIKSDTTRVEFDRERAKYPDHQLTHGGGCRTTVLSIAAQWGNTPLVKHIISIADIALREALLNTGDQQGATPLHYAVDNHHIETAKELIVSKANVNISTNFWLTPLYVAVEKSNHAMIKFLLKNGAEIAKPPVTSTLCDSARQQIEQVQKEIQDENAQFSAAVDEGTRLIREIPEPVLGIIKEYAPFNEEYTSPLTESSTESSFHKFTISIARMLGLV
jgi:ankyrin repeat protein